MQKFLLIKMSSEASLNFNNIFNILFNSRKNRLAFCYFSSNWNCTTSQFACSLGIINIEVLPVAEYMTHSIIWRPTTAAIREWLTFFHWWDIDAWPQLFFCQIREALSQMTVAIEMIQFPLALHKILSEYVLRFLSPASPY